MGMVRLTWLPCTPMEVALKKTTVAQQLVEQAADKQKKTWEELVPTIYHKFGQVFSEKASERFPG